MFNKHKNDEFLYDEPQDVDKKSPKKIIIDIIGIVLVIAFIFGTFFFIINREKIMASIPITRDENGNLVIKKKTNTDSRNTEEPKQADDRIVYNAPKNFAVDFGAFKEPLDQGYKFDLHITPLATSIPDPSGEFKFIIEKVTVDGFDFSNQYEIEAKIGEEIVQEIFLEKAELNQYSIIRPNHIYLYYRTEGYYKDDLNKKSTKQMELRTLYNTPMDNSIKGLITISDIAKVKISFFKQIDDIEYTYLYFDAKNLSGENKPTIRVKKLLINGKVYDYNDTNEEIYYLTEKLFYIRIPKKKQAKVENFTVSFFIVFNEDEDNEQIYITKEYTHEE